MTTTAQATACFITSAGRAGTAEAPRHPLPRALTSHHKNPCLPPQSSNQRSPSMQPKSGNGESGIRINGLKILISLVNEQSALGHRMSLFPTSSSSASLRQRAIIMLTIFLTLIQQTSLTTEDASFVSLLCQRPMGPCGFMQLLLKRFSL